MYKSQRTSFSRVPNLRQHPRFGPMSATTKILLLTIVHVVLAFLMRNYQLLSTLHALVTFGIGVWTALTAKDLKSVIPIAAYIMGAEVLWRMTDAGVFWEFGKYATIAILVIAILRKRKIEKAFLPILFFIVLIPSIILTINALGFTERAQQFISFNLSGPLAASVCMVFFRQHRFKSNEMQSWIWPAVYPILGILTLAAYSTLTATEIYFGDESVFITSGGYGPNQVSAVLGLGALLLVMLAISGEKKGRFLGIIFSLAFITQSFLTFSRGGVYNFAIGIIAAMLHLLRKPNRSVRRGLVVLIIGIIIIVLIFPQLEQFTGGMLSQRFTDLNVTSREDLAKADLQLFLDNPIFGVGPGMALYRRQGTVIAAAHTEYTRLLAEHGLGGVIALLILVILLAKSYFKAPDPTTRAWVVALAVWPMIEMTLAAMRVVAISFLLGMAMIGWEKEEASDTPDNTQEK